MNNQAIANDIAEAYSCLFYGKCKWVTPIYNPKKKIKLDDHGNMVDSYGDLVGVNKETCFCNYVLHEGDLR